jgi:AcrR family transcriptional regulator
MFDRMRGFPHFRQVARHEPRKPGSPGSVPETLEDDVSGTAGPVRSPPQQERSRRRYWYIVVAAAELFATVGYEATTMEAIASAASTSIGSVYRFFPNKPAVFRAVATVALGQIESVVLEVLELAGTATPHWHTLLDTAIDRLALVHREDPAVRAVLANLQLYGEYADEDEKLTRQFVAATAELFGVWAGSMSEHERQVVATMVVQTITGILVLAQREPPALADAMLDQLKLMLRRYLEPWIS